MYSQPPLQVAATGQPAVSQPAQPQQQLVQQPGPQGPQPGVGQVPGQSHWVPKTAIASPKPFTGDKRGEDLDTCLRSMPVYVKCKLTLPHEEVLVAASYLEGSAARWSSGLVQLQGYGHDFRAWAVNQKLEDFLKLVEERWHDPQEAQKATAAILTLNNRQFKSVREATDAVECLICVPGVRYDPQVLLTAYLRCFPLPLRNQLAGEANINMHSFPSFNKKALDLEAKIGHGHTPTTDGRKKALPPNSKAKSRIMFIDNDGSTIELEDDFQAGAGSEAGSVEVSGGGTVAAFVQKAAEQGTQLQMTSGNHPEANGQAEQMNGAVQHLLRHYIKPNQVDWDEKLALIASLYNNAVHSATGVSPNSLLLAFTPRLPLDFLLPENQPTAAPGTLEFAYRYNHMQLAVEHMHKAQTAMIESENKHRRPSMFQVGDRVWVKASEQGQEHGISRKLMPQYFGPWEVLDVVGNEPDGPSHVIRIPGHLRTYPVFHASKLAPSEETDQFPTGRLMLAPTMDGEVDIDDIVDHREMLVPRLTGRGRPPKPMLQYEKLLQKRKCQIQ
ncbi:hypothetical protein CBR_g21761 [Chara braunii]|uniref:Integrase catalytic domain-containing protein n=1 Tax=Chara braunii TaxID=69332 RepID=A0A388L1J7_CHABU|nr:hypothetical protein CBR_g21761 [Chara braunii]|eukprot:GBG76102.1 hypothetical protein CBR_g21761 [Chara braunii]